MRAVSFLFLLVWTATPMGCGRSPSEVGKHQIPVFKGSRLTNTDSLGARVGSSLSRMTDVTTTIWTFRNSASMDEIIAFYQSRFPNADQEDYRNDSEEPTFEFVWWPGDRNSEEEISISIHEGGFEIAETLED